MKNGVRIVLQQLTSKQAQANKLSGISIPKSVNFLSEYLSDGTLELLSTNDDGVHLWGVKKGASSAWEKIHLGTANLVLFREGDYITMRGASDYTFIDSELAKALWGVDPEDGETWEYIYNIKKLKKMDRLSAKEVNLALGFSENYNWQGLNVVTGEQANFFFEKYLSRLNKQRK